MRKELDDDYDISADSMLDMTKDQENNGFVLVDFFLYDEDNEKTKYILAKDNKQIFQMNDGKFILEVEDDGEVEYFYSKNLEDLQY